MSAFFTEQVTSVRRWTDRLFSFTATRDPAFRFINGQFTMIGLQVNGRPLVRAYSMVSSAYEERLEFLSIAVPDGPLTSRLQHVQPGDSVLVGRKPTGTLIQDNLLPGETLWLLATGTGLAPFLSIVKDPEAYERFDRVVLVHGVRWKAELAYGDYLERELPGDEFLGEMARDRLIYFPTVTREPFRNQGRITAGLSSGVIPEKLGLPPMDKERDRVMLCGSPAMLADLTTLLKGWGFEEGNHSEPGHYVVEKAFVEK
jgi:ferredoxin/flavodoxin---NADP+ reductase